MSQYLKGTQRYLIVKLKASNPYPLGTHLSSLEALFIVSSVSVQGQFIHIHANISIHLYVHICICMHSYIDLDKRVWCGCTYTCAHTGMHICILFTCLYTYIYFKGRWVIHGALTWWRFWHLLSMPVILTQIKKGLVICCLFQRYHDQWWIR